MQNKFKKSLLTIGSLATVAMPISAVVSCGSGTTNVSQKSDLEKADAVLNPMLERENYVIGSENTKNYDNVTKLQTRDAAPLLEYVKDGKKMKAKNGVYKTLKEEWETRFPVSPDKIKGDNLKPFYKEQWVKFVNGMGSDPKDEFKTSQTIFKSMNETGMNSQERLDMFDKDYWDDANSYSLREERKTKATFNTPFAAHEDSRVLQFYYAQFLNRHKDDTQDQAKHNMDMFIYRWNTYLNRRNWTMPAVTGAGYSTFLTMFVDPCMYGYEPHGNITDYSGSYKGVDGQIDMIHFFSSLTQKPNEKTLSPKDLKELKNKDGSWKTYNNPTLKKFVKGMVDDYTKDIFFENQHEYDNWYWYEAQVPVQFMHLLEPLSVDPEMRKLISSKWAAPFDWFVGDPLYQHKSKGAIYNSVPASKTMNSADNLLVYVDNSVKMDLIKGDFKKAKEHLLDSYTYLIKDFSGTLVDGFHRDGTFIQHNNMPYQSNYGTMAVDHFLKFLKKYKGTPLDMMKMEPGFKNVFKIVVKSFMPILWKQDPSTLAQGRVELTELDFLKKSSEVPLTGEEINIKAEQANDKYRSEHELWGDMAGLLDFADMETDQNAIQIAKFITEARRSGKNGVGYFKGLSDEKLKKDYFFTDNTLKLTDPSTHDENLNITPPINQMFGGDMIFINHDEKGDKNDWQFSTRFHDNRVGFYESELAQNTTGAYIGSGYQTINTGNNPHMYRPMYFAGVDPYMLPGTVAYKPEPIINPEAGALNAKESELTDAQKAYRKMYDGTKNGLKWDADFRMPYEWQRNAQSDWTKKINAAKTDATGQGFTGGVQMNGLSSTMNYSSSWDGIVNQRRSVFSLGDRIFILGQVQNPTDGVKLTLDNRRTVGNYGEFSGKSLTRGDSKDTAWFYTGESKDGYKDGYVNAPSKGEGEHIGYVSYDDDIHQVKVGIDDVGHQKGGLIDGPAAGHSRTDSSQLRAAPDQSVAADSVKVNFKVDGKEGNPEYVNQNTGTSHLRSWKSNDPKVSQDPLYNQHYYPNGYYNNLSLDLSKADEGRPDATFAYSIIPNADSLEAVAKQHQDDIANNRLNVVRNDQDAQILEYKTDSGEEYLFANIFENDNFNIKVDWFGDKEFPVTLTATKPTSMIFKRVQDKDGNPIQGKYEVVAQNALQNADISRVGFGKDVKALSEPMENYKLFKEQDDPQYWTDRQQTYQNGPFIQDQTIMYSEWFDEHSRARVERAKEFLGGVGEYFWRPDQIDLIPDERFDVQAPFHFYITIEKTQS